MAGKKGITFSEEHRKNISEALRKSWQTPERKEKAARLAGPEHFNVGRKWTPEQKEARRQWIAEHGSPRKGAVASDYTRAVQSWNRLHSQIGLSREEFIAEFMAGKRWCGYGRHFVPKGQASTHRAVCIEHAPADARVQEYRKKFGITPDWYAAKFAEQGSACGICGKTTFDGRRKHMHVDHDHVTGNVRGILCSRCNLALERLDTVSDWTIKALAYLAKYS